MLKRLLYLMLATPCWAAPALRVQAQQAPADMARRWQRDMPLLFIENRGQVAGPDGQLRPDVLFSAGTGPTTIFLTSSGIHYQFSRALYPAGYDPFDTRADASRQEVQLPQARTQTHHFSVTLEGANPAPVVLRQVQSRTEFNYYFGHCPEGVTHAAAYQRLVYQEVYPHIDWIVYSNGSQLKYDFLVKPGGDPASIRLRVRDAESTVITATGELLLKTSLGEIREQAPLSFLDGKPVGSRFRKNADGTIGFDVKAAPGATLRIDPAVVWATYFGGSAADAGVSALVDASGNVYMVGNTSSATGVANAGFQNAIGGGSDAFLAKFDSSGYLLWATYYGGTGTEQGSKGALDANGNIYLVGQSNTASGLASGGFQNTNGGGVDVLLVKFSPSGSRIWATYYGGTGNDNPVAGTQSICTDALSNVYVAGVTNSTSGIFSNGFQSTAGAGFLVKFDAAGNRVWGTYYNGSANGCAADPSGNVYLAGTAAVGATNIAANGYQNTAGGGGDAYLVKFDALGNRLWGTFYGGTSGEVGSACAADAAGNVYLAGFTSSANGIASGGFQNTPGGGNDAFLVKFNAAGSRIWGSYYGGSGAEQQPWQCTLDGSGNVLLAGVTASANNIASNGFQNTIGGGNDAYFAQISPAGSLMWGSYFGGTASEIGLGIGADAQGNFYLAGNTSSTAGIALPGTYQPALAGSTDAFLVKIGGQGLFTGTVSGSPVCAGSQLSIPYTLFGSFGAGNAFTAQLSDASGSFASPVNIGSAAGTTAGTISAQIPANTPAGNGYRIRVTASAPGIIAPNNGSNLTINANAGPAAVNITVSPNDTVCVGTAVTFTATPTNGGTSPQYLWVKNSVSGGSNSPTYTDNGVSSGDTFYVVMTGNASCATQPDTSNFIVMTVIPTVTPSVAIAVNPGDTLCAGTAAVFTATPANGGPAPAYQWFKNGIIAGLSSPTYTDNGLSSGDILSARLISNAACRTSDTVNSNSITMTVNAPVTPAVTITASPGSAICAGTAVSFSAAVVNGGVNPVYQWRRNGAVVAVAPAYAAGNLTSGETVTCTVTSSLACLSNDTAISNTIAMTVSDTAAPAVVITANPGTSISAGTAVTFTAAVTNGGTSPVYQWKRNGASTGANSPTYSSTTLSNSDVVTCTVTSSNACASQVAAVSNALIMQVKTGIGAAGSHQSGLRIVPNPNRGIFDLTGDIESSGTLSADILNPIGQVVYELQIPAGTTRINQRISLGQLAAGTYLLRLRTGYGTEVHRVVIYR